MRLRKSRSTPSASIFVPEETENLSPGAEPNVQNYLKAFFNLRDSEETRLRNLAMELLDKKILVESVNGVEVCYKIEGKNFTYSFDVDFNESIYCPLAHQGLTWNKRNNLTILTDAIAECETLAKLGYKAH
jgi:hypothetical protein